MKHLLILLPLLSFATLWLEASMPRDLVRDATLELYKNLPKEKGYDFLDTSACKAIKSHHALFPFYLVWGNHEEAREFCHESRCHTFIPVAAEHANENCIVYLEHKAASTSLLSPPDLVIQDAQTEEELKTWCSFMALHNGFPLTEVEERQKDALAIPALRSSLHYLSLLTASNPTLLAATVCCTFPNMPGGYIETIEVDSSHPHADQAEQALLLHCLSLLKQSPDITACTYSTQEKSPLFLSNGFTIHQYYSPQTIEYSNR